MKNKQGVNTLGLVALGLFFLCASCTTPRPVKECSTFVEMDDPAKDTLSNWTDAKGGLNISFASIDKRYAKSSLPQIPLNYKHKITGWKGEKLSAQVLLWTAQDVEQVEVEFDEFKSNSNTLPANIAQARFVRYVMTDEFAGGCGYRKPENFAASLSPDMLDNIDCLNLEAKTARPVWLTVSIPETANAGTYTSTISIYGRERDTQKLSLELEVIDQTLPKPSAWSFHLDQWQHPSAVARAGKLKMWSDEHFEAMKPLMQMLADAGQKVITANVNKDPWNNQCFDAYEDMILWTKKEDGSWQYDYTIFDRWITFMHDIGITKMINCYSIVPWNNELHYKDAATGKMANVKADPGTAQFKEIWGSFLPNFVAHLKEKGWLEKTNIAMDERNPQSMEQTIKLMNEVAPELGIALADNHKSYERYPNITDISIGAGSFIEPEYIAQRRAKGYISTYYVYCNNHFPNQFTFSDPAESTYMAWYAKAANLDGVLRWAYNSWVENPTTDSRFRTWPAGDTYIVYPDARSSIRYERLLEGIQDFTKIEILSKQLQEANSIEAATKLKDLNEAIAKLNTTERTKTWNEDLNVAKRLLNQLSSK